MCIGIIIVLFTSCKKEIEEFSVFKTDDITGDKIFYTLLEPSLCINAITIGIKDTCVFDTLFLDVNEDQIIDLTFIMEQKFAINISNQPFQKITIKTGSDILLQLMPGILPSAAYVRTATKGEKVDTDMPWVANHEFFLTHIKYNYVEAPRFEQPYLPFKIKNGDLGWIKMDFEIDNIGYITHRFYIESYCLKKLN
jgi:hypothetical protein